MSKLLSLRKNFAWAFTGNIVFFVSQWAMMMILAKLGSASIVGQYAVALAVCLPVFTFARLQLKAVLVTDAKDEYTFSHYLNLRFTTSTVSVLICVIIALFVDYSDTIRWLILVVAFNQAVFAVREILINVFVKQERMKYYAFSQFLQGGLSLLSFGITFYLIREILVSIIVMVLFRAIVTVVFDASMARKILGANLCSTSAWNVGILWRLTRLSIPLGIIMGLIQLRTSIPRLILEEIHGTAAVGYFSAVAGLLVALNLILNSTGQVAMPRLSKYFVSNRRAFKYLLLKLCLVGVGFGLLGMLISVFLGKWILTVLFTPAYGEYAWLLVMIMGIGVLYAINNGLGYGVTASRAFKRQLIPNILAILTCWFTAALLIPTYGIMGAAVSLIITTIISSFGLLVVVWFRLRE